MKAHWLGDDGAVGAAIDADTLRSNDVLCQVLPTNPAEFQAPLDRLKADHGYIEQDEVALRPETPGLDDICAKFDREHRHDEDEVRFVLDGSGIFDIRSRDDRYMRVEVVAGDLIVVPADRNHRFYLGAERTIHCVRLFKDKSGWVPHYRNEAAGARQK